MAKFGFSTGAIAYSDFNKALEILLRFDFPAIELSALREPELPVLLSALSQLDLSSFEYISFHAPSSINPGNENEVVRMLLTIVERGWPVIVHPDIIQTFEIWRSCGAHLLIENMDKRKPVGRTEPELQDLFNDLPDASMCFDVGHARQVDPTMTVASSILRTFRSKIKQLHVSEVDTQSKHRPLTEASRLAFASISEMVPFDVAVIIESTGLAVSSLSKEISYASQSLFENQPA